MYEQKPDDDIKVFYDDVHYVPQKRAMSCWYACSKMVYTFKRPDAKGVKKELVVHNLENASKVDELMRKSHRIAEERTDNIGATEEDWPLIAEAFGFEKVPERKVAEIGTTFEKLVEALQEYGPLWAAGRFFQGPEKNAGHVICVIGAVMRKGAVGGKMIPHVIFHDPAPEKLQGGPKSVKQYEHYFKSKGANKNGLYSWAETEGQSPLMYKPR